jgi:signal transduction histidine kinase
VAFLGRSFLEMRQSLRSHVEHLRSLDQMKGNFIALAGHELKTPLTVITSFNEMIVSGSLGAVPDNIRDPMRRIQERLWDLNRLVEDILDMSRFEQGLFEFRKVVTDPRELVVGILQQRRTNLQERDVRVVSQLGDGEVRVHGDPERLTQAVTNLVDNAIRFTPDGGTVTVTVTADADHARIAVRDTGVGIAAQELEWLFTKSQEIGEIQHHSSGRLRFGSRGLGLGLALCKAIVEGHGGSVHVHSVPGRGSEFTLVLPLYRGAAVPAEPVLV